MTEDLEFNTSTDLLNEFLGQPTDQSTPNIITDGEDEQVEIIEPNKDKQPKIEQSQELEITSELPKELLEQVPAIEEQIQESTGDYSFVALAEYLANEGIIDFEAAEGLEDNPEVLINSVNNTIAKEIQAYKESIPDKAKQIIEYLEKGGDIDSYLNQVQKPFDLKSVDLTSEKDQELIVRENLKLQGYDADEINETIQDYKDSLILEKQAKVADKQVKKHYERYEQQILETQAQEQELKQEQYRTYISNLNTTIDNSETLAGLPLDTKSKMEFKRYLLQTDKDGLTSYAREVAEDPIKTQLELAYLKFKKFDFSEAMKKGETVATQKLKNIFKQTEKSVPGRSVNETNKISDLSAFKQFVK